MSKITIWKTIRTENEHYLLEKICLKTPPQTLNSVSSQLPAGVYTTFRTYGGDKILPLEYQIQRLEGSARRMNRPLHLDERMVRDFLQQALAGFQALETRLRLSVDLEQEPGTLYLVLEPLRTPSEEDYARGVWVVTCPFRRQNPEAKQTSFIPIQEDLQTDLPEEAHEALLIDEHGTILEGLSSNFFAVRGDEVWTAGEAVLPGITRSLVLSAAGRAGLPVRLQSVMVAEIPLLQEAFLTSSSRSILPVRQIDDSLVGDGAPGPVTRRLAQAYWQEIQSRLVQV